MFCPSGVSCRETVLGLCIFIVFGSQRVHRCCLAAAFLLGVLETQIHRELVLPGPQEVPAGVTTAQAEIYGAISEAPSCFISLKAFLWAQ